MSLLPVREFYRPSAEPYHYRAYHHPTRRYEPFSGAFATIDEAEQWLHSGCYGVSNEKFWAARGYTLKLYCNHEPVQVVAVEAVV